MFKALNGPVLFFILQSPTQVYGPSQTLKSSTAALLTAPKAATKTYGDAAFQPLRPKVMAKISGLLTQPTQPSVEKLQTHRLRSAYN